MNENVLAWLLEPDPANPGVRYFTLKGLLDQPADAPEVTAAQEAVMASGPVPAILAAQAPEGYWVEPGPDRTTRASKNPIAPTPWPSASISMTG